MSSLPVFDELYCISDLHIGGRAGFQVFRQGSLLEKFLGHLAGLDSQRRIVLVINGDFIDFLAEAQGRRTYLDTVGAVDTLKRIFVDPSFEPALTALGEYVRTENRFLAITLGNHDLELALPEVAYHLVHLLVGGDVAARGRIHLALDGTGFDALIGGGNGAKPARVLATHGNEADPSNVTDHEALRRVARDLRRGIAPRPWDPNAGTKLVIDLMNDIKAELPFVDVIKPEFTAAIPIVVALRPRLLSRIKDLIPVVRSLVRDSARSRLTLLGEAGQLERPPRTLSHPTLPPPGTARRAQVQEEVRDLLDVADRRLAEGVDPLALAAARRQDERLGLGGLVIDLFRGRDPKENLREALLDWIAHAGSGGLHDPDRLYEELGTEAGAGVDVVLTGHTHRPRAIRRKNGGLYYNSGSWIDRIELTRADLAPARFDRIYAALTDRAALDELPGLLDRRPTVVHLAPTGENGRVVGRLGTLPPEGGPDLDVDPGSVLEVRS